MRVDANTLELENNLEDLVYEVALTGQPVIIQRDGKDAAILVSYEEWQHMLDGWVTIDLEWSSKDLETLRRRAEDEDTTIPNIIREALIQQLDREDEE